MIHKSYIPTSPSSEPRTPINSLPPRLAHLTPLLTAGRMCQETARGKERRGLRTGAIIAATGVQGVALKTVVMKPRRPPATESQDQSSSDPLTAAELCVIDSYVEVGEEGITVNYGSYFFSCQRGSDPRSRDIVRDDAVPRWLVCTTAARRGGAGPNGCYKGQISKYRGARPSRDTTATAGHRTKYILQQNKLSGERKEGRKK
ncbi:hypothetical protein E2C01_034928 [Portunus trituberculatus]|uniref:Uncharacterized protein n=1 Tax=Portunus trituberculatus TaxID=210409 RepID=A0A5B7F1U6_PORTR|nr:hypothetical protein [Portunus trituberculatus]